MPPQQRQNRDWHATYTNVAPGETPNDFKLSYGLKCFKFAPHRISRTTLEAEAAHVTSGPGACTGREPPRSLRKRLSIAKPLTCIATSADSLSIRMHLEEMINSCSGPNSGAPSQRSHHSRNCIEPVVGNQAGNPTSHCCFLRRKIADMYMHAVYLRPQGLARVGRYDRHASSLIPRSCMPHWPAHALNTSQLRHACRCNSHTQARTAGPCCLLFNSCCLTEH